MYLSELKIPDCYTSQPPKSIHHLIHQTHQVSNFLTREKFIANPPKNIHHPHFSIADLTRAFVKTLARLGEEPTHVSVKGLSRSGKALCMICADPLPGKLSLE